MKYVFLLTVSVLMLASCKKEGAPNTQPAAPSLYFPPIGSTEWQTTKPEDLGWKTANLPALYDYLQQQDTRAFLVLKDGKIVLEKYFGLTLPGNAPFEQNSMWYWASAGKTLTGFLVGKAREEGKVDINKRVSAYIASGWSSAPLAKENLITVRHLLTMTSGLEDAVGDPSSIQPSDLKYKADAGTRWAYHNGPYLLLMKVLTLANVQSFSSYFDQKLKNRIGMDGQWMLNGNENLYWSTARSMARFGILIQGKGKWDGTTILGDTAFLTASTTTSQNINLSYGYLWWLNGKSSFMVPQSQIVFPGEATPNAPDDLIAAMGRDGQLLNIVPSKGLIVVRMRGTVNNGLVSMPLQNDMWEKLNAVMN